MKAVNLNDYFKQAEGAVPIEVGNKEFLLADFPQAASELMGKFASESQKAVAIYTKYIDILKKLTDAQLEEDETKKQKIIAKLTTKAEKLQETIPTDEDLTELLYSALAIVLLSNNYKFDRKFWDKNCSVTKINLLLQLAMNKGNVEDYARKKQLALATGTES